MNALRRLFTVVRAESHHQTQHCHYHSVHSLQSFAQCQAQGSKTSSSIALIRTCHPQDALRAFRINNSQRLSRSQRVHHQSRQYSHSSSSNKPPNMDSALHSKPTNSSELLAATLEKPDPDNREYRVIRLSNKLEALLIHDPDTDKASAALDVNAGAFCDEEDMPGMAHAVEHLLFMGTEKFPQENEYNQYLTARSGYSNAFTASTSTNYYFELAASSDVDDSAPAAATADGVVKAENDEAEAYLYGALDRFAQFFIAPLFLEETLDRELRAVDSENKKNLQSDMWRLYQLDKSLSNPEHPYHGFSTGSLKTLRDDPLARGVAIRERFIKFHKDHYSANRMKLVVLGRESLDKLQSWVEKLFADVPNKDLPQNRWDGIPILTKKELLTEVRAKPVMDTRTLEIEFPYPDEESLFESRPSGYLSHLIGHEGPGSILAYLKTKGWVNELSAGADHVCPGASLFTVTMRLTDNGLQNYKEVAKTVFQYISILKEKPPQEWIFDEVKDISQINFRFKQKGSASSTTSGLSQAMQMPYPRDRILSGRSVLVKFNPEAIIQGLGCLNPENFRLGLISQSCLEGRSVEKEKWYGTEYCFEKIAPEFLAELKKAASSSANERPAELYLPHKNEFIPSKLDVEKKKVAEPAKAPKLVRNEENVRLWYKKDDQFWVPKADLYLQLRNQVSLLTARNGTMSQLFVDLVEDSLSDYAYSAELAGLSYNIQVSYTGLSVVVSGFNDKMPVLLEKVLTTLRDLELKQDRFEIIKERLERGYRNWAFSSPYSMVGAYDRWLNHEHGFIIDDYHAELDSISLQDVRQFRYQLLGQMHIEALAHGNLHLEDALRLVDTTERILKPHKLPQAQWPILRSIMLPRSSNYLYSKQLKDPSNINHCIQYTVHVGDVADRNLYAKLMLWSQLTHERAFDQLRTKEQLGYIVFSGTYKYSGSSAYRVLIQSERTPEYLEKRIDSFLTGLEKELEEMSAEVFESHRRSVINDRLEKVKNLGQESSKFWAHISDQYYFFDQVDDDVARLKKITKEEMQAFYKTYIDPASTTQSKICVHMVAQGKSADATQEKTVEEQRAELFTLVKQHLVSTGLEVDSDKLKSRFDNLDLTKKEQQEKSIVAAIKSHLQEDAGMALGKIESMIEEGKSMLGDALASVGVSASHEGGENSDLVAARTQVKGKEATVIEDVRQWQSGMPLMPGPRPFKDLSEFEELAPKL